MKDTMDLKNLLEMAYEPTPETFHRRVQDTLCGMKREAMKEEQVVKRKISWAAAALAALLLVSAVGIAANMDRVLGFITNTMAKNWVLDEAQNMTHRDAASATLGSCTATVTEWVSDGEQLIASVSLIDPALETQGHFVPEDEEEEYLGGLSHYGLYHGPQELYASEGTIGSKSWHFEWGDEINNEIIYTFTAPLTDIPDAFTVTVPVKCSEGIMNLSFDVNRTDFGDVRRFEDSGVMQADGYTAQIVDFRATALRTYATLILTFDESMPTITRKEIASDYLDGLGVPEGRLDAVAGEGEEIVMARTGKWSEDGLVCTIEMNSNPREKYPDTMAYCPRWGMHDYDWEGDMPPLSMDGAVVMKLKEVR